MGYNMRGFPLLILFLVPALCLNSVAQEPKPKKEARDSKTEIFSVLSVLILGTNESSPLPTPFEIAAFHEKLKGVFGYNQFEVIGQHTEVMDSEQERWLIPSKNFSLAVKSKKTTADTFELNLRLFQQLRLLTSFKARLSRESPLFIKGPLYDNGQLIIMVLVK